MDEKERAFRRARNAAVARRTALLQDTRAEIVRQLQLAQERIQTTLAAQPTDYQRWYLPQLSREIGRALAELGEASAATLATAAGTAWQAGEQLIDAPLEAAGIRVAGVAPAIDTRQLFAMRAFMTDRIRDVSVQAANKINTELGLTVIGAQPVHETIGRVAEILGPQSRARATTIVRTELGRAYSVAAHERLAQAAKRVPGMRKEWRKSGKLHPRPHHDAANGQVVDHDQPFILHGPKGEVRLMFPHDPRAPAEETINCGCVMLPRPPAFGPAVRAGLAEAYNPRQPRAPKDSPSGGQWISSLGQGIRALVEHATPGASFRKTGAGAVNVRRVKAKTGIDLSGYKAIIDNHAMRHALKQHGAAAERLRGQIPITRADFQRVPMILRSGDIRSGGVNRIGRKVIVFSARHAGERNWVSTEVRTGRKELAFQSMWKRKNRGGK